ncbi:Methyltransferase domain-containing protein [Paraoerskovia marina]|uniref:Methyltransferase domain-containing protein n=1 Tax=Paraoerskovia marina TaxID=545619 RepID=A0A1H1MW22_9CELL|nr:class I SAM-dependent methyltransferase [Paraoerskovia marina]SDR91073.1 Methyltransferase domain-containing protein [Paraoerskovia marina]
MSHHHDHPESPVDDAHMIAMLDADALVAGTLLDDLADLVAEHAPHPVRSVVDLGAGTGTGTRALAARFPDAHVTAVDSSPAMLDRIRAASPGLDGRLTLCAADLDAGWPDGVGPGDVVWSALALHHVSEPAAFLGTLKDHLTPDGVVALVEMDAHPRYLPHDLGLGEPGLEERLHAAIDTGDMDPHPDWTATLADHGYDVVARQQVTITPSDTDAMRHLAHLFLAHVADRVATPLSPSDAAVLAELLGDGPASVRHRDDLDYRATRTVWIARR